ncbi:MAG: LacI family DNA-binding transcriptional regulator [Eubacteriales bacterium]|nr:LacI family DNA-binding transcriptional regulator [Eubacteriales bacterium]
MPNNVTMKDLAAHFGVSLNTIHKAINDKPGISEATRKKILSYADECGYKRNQLAANLKKNVLSIAVCCPGNTTNSRIFYDFIWEGIRDYFQKNEDLLNIRLVEFPYEPGRQDEVLAEIFSFVEAESLDGLILTPPKSEDGERILSKLEQISFPIVFVTDDNPLRNCVGSVCADYYTAGRMMAEQFLNLRPEGGKVLLLSGDHKKASHFNMCQGFSDYNKENASRLEITNLYGYHDYKKLKEDFSTCIHADMPDMIGAVLATGSSLIREMHDELDIPLGIPIIGNDLFEETILGMQEGIFTNLVYKDPVRQGFLSAKMLCEYLAGKTQPENRHIKVEASMIFRSNLFYYTKNIPDT